MIYFVFVFSENSENLSTECGDLHTSEMWRCTDFVTSELGDPNFSVCVSVLLITPRNIIVFYSHSDSLVIRVYILSPQSPQICGDELKNSKIKNAGLVLSRSTPFLME